MCRMYQGLGGGVPVFPSFDQLTGVKPGRIGIPTKILLSSETTTRVRSASQEKLTIGEEPDSYTNKAQLVSQKELHMPDHRLSIISHEGRDSSSATRGPPPPARGREKIEADAAKAEAEAAARQKAAREKQLDPATRRNNLEIARFEKEYGTSTSPQPAVKPPPPAGRNSSSATRDPLAPLRGSPPAARSEQERRELLESMNQRQATSTERGGPPPVGRGSSSVPRGPPPDAGRGKEIVDNKAKAKAEAEAEAIKQEDDRRKQERLNSPSPPNDQKLLNAAEAESARTAEKGKIKAKEAELEIKGLGKKTSPLLQQTAAGQPKARAGSASDILRIRDSLI